MSTSPTPEPQPSASQSGSRADAEYEVTTRVTEFLLRHHSGFREIHDSRLENAFELRARAIYGLDRFSFGGVDVAVSAIYECDDEAMVALIHVRDETGLELYPDLRRDVLCEYQIQPEKPGVVLEPLVSASQATLVTSDGDPRNAKLLPFFSDQAYEELDQHRSSAVLRLKALRAVDSYSCYPVGEPSLLVHMMLRAVRDELSSTFLGDPIQREVYTRPMRIGDIQSREGGLYDIRISRFRLDSSSTALTPPVSDETHRVSLQFNRFYGKIERRYIGLQESI